MSMKYKSAIIHIKATEQYFPVVLTLYKVVLTLEYVDEVLKRNHSNERYITEHYTLLLWNVYNPLQLRWFY